MKIIVSNLAWLPKRTNNNPDGLTIEQQHSLKSSLTIIPRIAQDFADMADSSPIYAYQETDKLFGVPRAFFFANMKQQHDIVFDVCNGEAIHLPTTNWRATGKYEEQSIAVEAMVNALINPPYGAMLHADCGCGKTILAIEIARRLGCATLVIVHKEFLLEQWQERILSMIPYAKIGIAQQNECNFRDNDFVITLVQSLMQRDYGADFYRHFGTVVIDEAHHFSSRAFSKTILQFPAKYKIGLTATPSRSDCCENLFFWNVGGIAFHSNLKPMPFKAKIIRTGWKCHPRVSRPVALSLMSYDAIRTRTIVDELMKAIKTGRKVLAMGERLHLLESIKIEINRMLPNTTIGIFCGEWFVSTNDRNETYKRKTKKNPNPNERKMRFVTKHERKVAQKCQLVLATKQTVEDALDIWDLDTLFMVTPVSSIEQPVGRIRRWTPENADHGKKEPIVVDFVDEAPVVEKLYKYRAAFYRENNAMPTTQQSKLVKQQTLFDTSK